MMERKIITSVMALMMIVSMFFLARYAAVHTMSYREEGGKAVSRGGEVHGGTNGIRLVIDAGHGGSDPGKVGVNGEKEKDINLAIALLVEKKLIQAGFEVVMTRTQDGVSGKEKVQGDGSGKAADMRRRVDIINECGARVLISIHQNSYSSPNVRGPQVFYYDSSAEGEKLARIMQEQLNTGMEVEKPRKIKANDNYYLLRKSKITAIIVECGFLSNAKEAGLLCMPEYQERLADSIVQAICIYTGQQPGAEQGAQTASARTSDDGRSF